MSNCNFYFWTTPITEQYEELTEQRNLYGRIDRIITFGTNTYGDWTPRMIEDSNYLAKLLDQYQESPTEENRQLAKEQFDKIYNNMLIEEGILLQETDFQLNSYIDEILNDLIK